MNPLKKIDSVIFIPDNKNYTINLSSDLGWYVLYSQKLSEPQLFLRKNATDYIGYSTKPLATSKNTPQTLQGLGKCKLIYCRLEDSINKRPNFESSDGNQKENFEYSGRIIKPKTIDFQKEGSMSYAFILEINNLSLTTAQELTNYPTNCDLVQLNYKIIPHNGLINNKIFGLAIGVSGVKVKLQNFELGSSTSNFTTTFIRDITNKITSIILTSTDSLPFQAKFQNNTNIYVKITPDFGQLTVNLKEFTIDSLTATTVTITIDNPENKQFEPIAI
jgi:hypothetical protein